MKACCQRNCRGLADIGYLDAVEAEGNQGGRELTGAQVGLGEHGEEVNRGGIEELGAGGEEEDADVQRGFGRRGLRHGLEPEKDIWTGGNDGEMLWKGMGGGNFMNMDVGLGSKRYMPRRTLDCYLLQFCLHSSVGVVLQSKVKARSSPRLLLAAHF